MHDRGKGGKGRFQMTGLRAEAQITDWVLVG
jgi:hypothetical protein